MRMVHCSESSSCSSVTLFQDAPWLNFGDIAGLHVARYAARMRGANVCKISRETVDSQPRFITRPQKAAVIGTKNVVIGLGSVLHQLAECVPTMRCANGACWLPFQKQCALNTTRFGMLTSRIRWPRTSIDQRSSLPSTVRNIVVWGSGVLGPSRPVANAMLSDLSSSGVQFDVRALRGPLSLEYLASHGLLREGQKKRVVLGDPAMVLPIMYPRCHRRCSPERALCVIPHRNDEGHLLVNHSIKIGELPPSLSRDDVHLREIDTPFATMLEWILGCGLVASSSLHGLIFADAFGVPARWLQLPGSERSEGWTKYLDHYSATRPHILQAYQTLGPHLASAASVTPWPSAKLLGDCRPARSLREAWTLGGAPLIKSFDASSLLMAFPVEPNCNGVDAPATSYAAASVGASHACLAASSFNCTGETDELRNGPVRQERARREAWASKITSRQERAKRGAWPSSRKSKGSGREATVLATTRAARLGALALTYST